MKKISIFITAITFTTFLLAGCTAGNVKITPPASQSTSAILIQIDNICLPLMPCSNQTITFARLSDNANIKSKELYQTSVMRDNHYYLLNAKPGTYVAVAASYERGSGFSASSGNVGRTFSENILFSKAFVEKTKIQVTPGALSIMGNYEFDINGRMGFAPSAAQFLEKADPIQAYYAKTIDPEMDTRGATSATKFYRGDLTSAYINTDTKRQLLESATGHIGNAGWSSQLKNSKI